MSTGGSQDSPTRVCVLGGFAVVAAGDGDVSVSDACSYVVGFLAVNPGAISRERIAETLWPGEVHDRAASRLRTTLSRLKQQSPGLVSATNSCLTLSPVAIVDYLEARSLAHALLERPPGVDGSEVPIELFEQDLLPDWAQDWVTAEREAFRQLRFAALEHIAETSIREARFARAVQASLSVIGAEPLRESAQRLLVQSHAANGNMGEALRQVDQYTDLLKLELGVPPSPLMLDLRAQITNGV